MPLSGRGWPGWSFPGVKTPGCSLDIWKTKIVLRRSKIFIATGIQIAVSSVVLLPLRAAAPLYTYERFGL
jgi:hypothetical protein